MKHLFFFASTFVLVSTCMAQHVAEDSIVRSILRVNQYDLSSAGEEFFIREAGEVSFFMLGELHGEQEIPELLFELWPSLNKLGYQHIAAELSPWAAHKLEFPLNDNTKVKSLWSLKEVAFVHQYNNKNNTQVIWACDMDDMQLHLLIGELASANPADLVLKRMAAISGNDFKRQMAPELLALMSKANVEKDIIISETSLFQNIADALEVESDRLQGETRLHAQMHRENVMKRLFLRQYEKFGSANEKVFFRFGRNHLHRGLDGRGVSTLGNFVAELAVLKNLNSFSVAAFACGGNIKMMNSVLDADERSDDLAFSFLSQLKNSRNTVFDLRPLRHFLHRIPFEKRSALQSRLVYWSDSYDAIICYETVTPLEE